MSAFRSCKFGGLEILRGSIVQILLFSAGGRRGSLLFEIRPLERLAWQRADPPGMKSIHETSLSPKEAFSDVLVFLF